MKKNKIIFFLMMIFFVNACSFQNDDTTFNNLKRNYNKIEVMDATMYIENNSKKLEKRSDIIVSGKPVEEVSEDNSFMPNPIESDGKMPEEKFEDIIENEIVDPAFVSKVKIENVYKGEYKDNYINIVFDYAIEDNTLYTYEDELPSYKGLEYVYFLGKYENDLVKQYNKAMKTNYKELYYTISTGTGMINTDSKDKENLEIVESILPKKDVDKLQDKFGE